MAAAVVTLVVTSTFVFGGLEPAAIATTPLVRRMPTFAWASGVLVTRIISNTMASGSHNLSLLLHEAAPTCEDPQAAFVGGLWEEQFVVASDAAGTALLKQLDWHGAPPFADLVVKCANVGAAAVAGSVTLSVDFLVRGRSFDRVEWAQREHREKRS